MNLLARYNALRWIVTASVCFLINYVLLQYQKGIHTESTDIIFYFQGKPGSFLHVFFACTIAVYLYTWFKKDWKCKLKRWILVFNTICFIVLLPLQVFSIDSYFYLSHKGVAESSFWGFMDQENLSWQQLNKATLSVGGDDPYHTISNDLSFANGKTYHLDISSMGKERFIQLVHFLHSQQILLDITPLTDEQQVVILKNYGIEMLNLWHLK